MRKLKQNKGITLVALILTIVILLILAVVTIRSIQGEGIIAKAIGAREKYEGAADEEQGILDKYLQDMEGISSGISQDGSSSGDDGSTEEVFNPEEWDEGAPKEEDNVFIWKSDDPNSPDYGVVIGYTANADNYSILRYPTRCTKITLEYDENRYASIGNTMSEALAATRSFTNNVLKLEIPGTVKSVYLGASSGASNGHGFKNLENVEMQDGVITIEDRAFLNCANLKSITIPNSVTTIGSSAFGSTSLTNIIIPNSVTNIGSYAFSDTNLTSITIPDSVTSIESGLFNWCTNLTNITIPESITSIGDTAFYSCTSLTNIKIPDNVTRIGYSAFVDCTNLTEIIIPNNVTSIGCHAFNGCISLSRIVIPNSVTSIEYNAFYGWTSNQTINCRVSSKPSGWDYDWNDNCDANVVWGYTGE